VTTRKHGYAAAAELSGEPRDGLGSLLLSLADNKRLLGMRYGEWLLGAPTLEAGIACSAMAQDEWGHGRIVYAMLKDFGSDPTRLEHERESDEYRSSELLDDPPDGWPQLIALNLLLDTALSVQFQAMQNSRFEPLHHKVKKLLEEERFHFEHARGWTARLARAEAGRDALHTALERAWAACLRWFGSPAGGVIGRLHGEGIVDADSDELRGRWLARVGPVVHDAGIGLAEPEGDGAWRSTVGIDWTGWDGDRRRTGPGGPNAETLAGVRGDKNRALLMD
jgi:ring-1,2-phenylacetyl-CoA epoxidase subunit PaaC